MEKVKITQKQADSIERHKEEVIKQFQKLKDNPKGVHDWVKPLLDMSTDDYMDAIHVGYEIEPEFVEGDHIVTTDGVLCEISRVFENDEYHISYIKKGIMHSTTVDVNVIDRHATKQEVWWASHGREVWELKDHDLLIDITTGEICTAWIQHNDLHLTTSGDCILSVYDAKKLKNNYEIICFAEDRKDV